MFTFLQGDQRLNVVLAIYVKQIYRQKLRPCVYGLHSGGNEYFQFSISTSFICDPTLDLVTNWGIQECALTPLLKEILMKMCQSCEFTKNKS